MPGQEGVIGIIYSFDVEASSRGTSTNVRGPVSPSTSEQCGPPNVSPSVNTCVPCGSPNVSQKDVVKLCGFISIRSVDPQDGGIPAQLLTCEEDMVFIVDSGASRMSTFEKSDFVEGSLQEFKRPLMLTGISSSLEIKGEGDV